MLMNVVFVAVLFLVWRGPSDLADGWLAGIARVPGLHMALALASALASYLNVWLLWRALRREGIYVRQPGWEMHLARLMAACAAMVAVLLAGVFVWRGWGDWPTLTRVWRLGVLIGGASAAFVGVLLASGFRLRDLRAH
jgi:putative peptidoglycan lipid II flippase